jgi:hypothetical protein
MKEVMEDDLEENANLLESLLEKTADYGKTSFELLKLKALDKSSDIISTIIPVLLSLHCFLHSCFF